MFLFKVDFIFISFVPFVLQAVIDTIGKVAANSLETVLYAACRDQLIPSFDRGCQNILSQVDETFQKGIRMCKFLIRGLYDAVVDICFGMYSSLLIPGASHSIKTSRKSFTHNYCSAPLIDSWSLDSGS